MRFCILASGSAGNSCYFETENTRILIDAGLSCREIERRLHKVDVKPSGLDAIVITHEHTDHVQGAGPISRRFDVPVYMNRKTFLKGQKTLGNIRRPVFIETGQTILIQDICLETFTKCHDAADPFALVVSLCGESSEANGLRIGIATDMGRFTGLLVDRLKNCDALIVEFNYDQGMLENGPYPLDLKRRIKGQDGHLSNHQAGGLLSAVSHLNLRHVVLAHLSRTNNHPEKAYQEAEDVLRSGGLDGTDILVSRQDEPGPMIEL